MRKKPRLSGLSPKAAKEKRKQTLKEYAQSRHVIRVSNDTWIEWNQLKDESNAITHDEFALRLLQR